MALINFKLRHPNNITPWGTPHGGSMHWFGLTDGEYWLQVGKAKIYEYTPAFRKRWDLQDQGVVDYDVSRLLEDFCSIFDVIAEPIPEDFYQLVKSHSSFEDFYNRATSWLEYLSDDSAVDIDTYVDRYDNVMEWIYSRTLTAMHLRYGPVVSFFRSGQQFSIIWQAAQVTEEHIPVWTAGVGERGMTYEEFVSEVEDFCRQFFSAMELQVELAVQKNWGIVDLDKQWLVREQVERKAKFEEWLNILRNGSERRTDWKLVAALIEEMNLWEVRRQINEL